jgi:arabinofuranosyltransferase
MSIDESRRIRVSLIVGAVGVLAFSLLFLKNAWVDEDAYITFRSVEQLFAGNGPRWNPHERVQAFTHPLWLVILTSSRLLTHDLFISSLVVSWLCSMAALLGAARLLGNRTRWLILVLLLGSSKSFFDFTSSGLETPLAYALLSAYLFVFWRSDAEPGASDPLPEYGRDWLILNLILAALLLVRHDLLFLIGPAHLHAGWRLRTIGTRRCVEGALLGSLPILVWTGFSLVYYGFPFPNPVYANLDSGAATPDRLVQGIYYLQALVHDDPLTAFVIGVGIGLAAFRGGAAARSIAAGLALNLAYVVIIGGGYMTGRLFACSYLVATLMLLRTEPLRPEILRAALVAATALAILLPGSPIMSDRKYVSREANEHGIGDRRGQLFRISSFHAWRVARQNSIFPNERSTVEGVSFKGTPNIVRARENVGFMGYAAGTEPVIIDLLALADPLLARLPSTEAWRMGRFPRLLPDGYLKTVQSGEAQIVDPGIRRFHEKLALITEADLLTPGRLTTILKMNLGLYNHLLESAD